MTVDEYLSTHDVKKLQLGCGGNMLAGWLNTDGQCDGWFHPDGVRLNITETFPLPDNTFDYVYSEHVIEHVTYWQGFNMLQESFRVLKPGGRIRISTPSIELAMALLDSSEDSQNYIEYLTWADDPYADPMFAINKLFRSWGHTHLYTKPGLKLAMASAGFVDLTEHSILESTDPNLQKLETVWNKPDYDGITSRLLQTETMTIEAVKPNEFL